MKLSELLKLEPSELNKLSLDEINKYLPKLSQAVKRRVRTLESKGLSYVSLSVAEHDTDLIIKRKQAKNIFMAKAFLFDAIHWLNLETSTVTGTRKWIKNINKSLGTKMNETQINEFFNIFNKYKEMYKTGLALYGSSSLMKTVYNVVFDKQNQGLNEIQLTNLIDENLRSPKFQLNVNDISTNNKIARIKRSITNEIDNAKNRQMAERRVTRNAKNKNIKRKK